MPRNITSPQLSPDWMKTPITKVRSSPGRLQQDLPAKWTHESRPSDGTKSNHEHKFVTVPLLDGFRAGLSNITSLSALKVMSSLLGTLAVTPGDRSEMVVEERVWERQHWPDGGLVLCDISTGTASCESVRLLPPTYWLYAAGY